MHELQVLPLRIKYRSQSRWSVTSPTFHRIRRGLRALKTKSFITTFKRLRLLFRKLNFLLGTWLFYLLFVIVITRFKIRKFWNISLVPRERDLLLVYISLGVARTTYIKMNISVYLFILKLNSNWTGFESNRMNEKRRPRPTISSEHLSWNLLTRATRRNILTVTLLTSYKYTSEVNSTREMA